MPKGMSKGTTMKKLLSVVLALTMVLTAVVTLIPTAWAEPGDPAGGAGGAATTNTSTRPEGSWVYYEQNFDDATLAALTNADLAAALGWTAPTDAQAMSIEDGVFHFVSKNTGKAYQTDLYSAEFDSEGKKLDARMHSSITVIEYDLKFQNKTEEFYSSQATYVIMGCLEDQDNDVDKLSTKLDATKFPATGTFNTSAKKPMRGTHKKLDSTQELNLGLVTNHVNVVNSVPMADGASSCFDTDYHVKAVVDPVTGTYYLMLNDVVVSTLNDTENFGGALRALIAKMTEVFVLELPKGADVLLDNIQIYGYEPAPSLVITEIATNGGAGGYQWVELYNATLNPINVFDYALYVNNDPAAATYFGGAGLGYFSAFGEPVYADGALQPGETAIALLPSTAVAAGMDVSGEAFREYLTGVGAPIDTKIFTCDNTTEDPFVLAANGGMVVGLMEVDKETGVGKYVGLNDTLRVFLESYVIMTTNTADSNMGYEGLALHEGIVPCGINFGEAGKTVELTYWNVHAENVTSRMANVKYDASAERETVTGEKGTQTPGFVPVDCRFEVSILVYDENGENPTVVTDKFMTEWKDPFHQYKNHYKFIGYSVEGIEELVQTVKLSSDGLKVRPVYERTSPYANWYQVSELAEDGTYTVRLLGGINRKDIYSAGFRYSYSYINEKGREITYTPEEDYVCNYVYTSVLADGTEVTAEDLGCDYLFALHVRGIPAEKVTNLTFKVTAFIVDESTGYSVSSEENSFAIVPPVAPTPGA